MGKINKLGYIAIGMIIAMIIGAGTSAFAATKDIAKQLIAYFTSGGKPITIYANGNKVTKDSNGKGVTPFTSDGITYVPVRAVAEALGKSVTWDGATASVKIDDIKAPWSNKDSNAKLITTIDTNGEYHDKLDYTFTPDKDTVGEWVFYDVIRQLSDFNSKQVHVGPQGWDGISFYEDGTLIEHHVDGISHEDLTGSTIFNWTKGYIMNTMGRGGDKVVPAYSITIADGKTFMIIEWKSGYYARTGKIECYYVFVKTSNTPAPVPSAKTTDSKITVTKDADGVIHESMDYKYELDKDAVGKWEAINFVVSPDDFDGKDTTRQSFVGISISNFYDNGREAHYADKTRGAAITQWTKGYIWGTNDTISEYEIKQLNGKTFMFVQWKTGDYTVRGQKPNYIVYVKTSNTPDPEFAK